MADEVEFETHLGEDDRFSDQSSNDGDLSDDEEDAEEGEKENPKGNQGWANVMASILNKSIPEKQAPVLSKSKRLKRAREEKDTTTLKTKVKAMEHHELLEKDHVIPDLSTHSFEKNLQKIATRGVVKLFNAVSKHQKELEGKLQEASTESKKSKVMQSVSKSDFLDMLKNKATSKGKDTERNNNSKKTDEEESKTSSWNILRNDFMMGATMKDWDKEKEEEQESEELSESEEEEIEYEND